MTFEEDLVRQQVVEELERIRRARLDRVAWRYRWKPRLRALARLVVGRPR